MNDFITDRVTLPAPISTVYCDRDGCTAHITAHADLTESEAAAMARSAGWSAKMGRFRFSHHCPRHAEVKR